MKPHILLGYAIGFAFNVPTAYAAVIQTPGLITVAGQLDGGLIAPDQTGDTLDYVKFEMIGTGSVTVTSGFGSGLRLLLAEFIGVQNEFGFIGLPYWLEQTSPETWDSLTRNLDAGTYVAIMGVRDHTSYDVFDGFVAVNPEGGGFTFANYAYSIAGDVRALEYWDGHLDGTFTVTQIPEPTSGTLALLAAAATVAITRRRSRRINSNAHGGIV